MKLNNKDKQLVDFANEIIKENEDLYVDSELVACVILAKSGKIYKGVNIKSSHSVCAEQVALGQALACGEREFETLVAVMKKKGETNVVTPCGVCRYTFDKLNLNMNVIVNDEKNNKLLKTQVSTLLPYQYKR